MIPKYYFAFYNDWVGFYVDGKLVYEGHDIEPMRVLDEIGVTDYGFDSVYEHDAIEAMGWRMPNDLKTFLAFAEKEGV